MLLASRLNGAYVRMMCVYTQRTGRKKQVHRTQEGTEKTELNIIKETRTSSCEGLTNVGTT